MSEREEGFSDDSEEFQWEERLIPEIPGVGSGDSDEYISTDDVRRQIEERLDDETDTDVEISEAELQEIEQFLIDINVRNIELVNPVEIDALWHLLKENPSLVKDFTYSVLHAKERLKHSTYPVAISWEELFEYAIKLKKPDEVRPWLIAESAPHFTRLGFESREYVDRALSESTERRVRPDAIRFLGWLVSRRFMGDLKAKKKEFQSKYKTDRFTIPNLATIATITVAEHLTDLEKATAKYNQNYITEREALIDHEEIVLAMRGVYRMCGVMFLDKGNTAQQ